MHIEHVSNYSAKIQLNEILERINQRITGYRHQLEITQGAIQGLEEAHLMISNRIDLLTEEENGGNNPDATRSEANPK